MTQVEKRLRLMACAAGCALLLPSVGLAPQIAAQAQPSPQAAAEEQDVLRAAEARLEERGIGYRLGSPNAPVRILQFSDLECPHCKYLHEGTWSLIQGYVEQGKVQYVNYPVHYPQHTLAVEAALHAACAGEQGPGHYAGYRDRLFQAQEEWSGNPEAGKIFRRLAEQEGVDLEEFDACIQGGDDLRERLEVTVAQAGLPGLPLIAVDGQRVRGNRTNWEKVFKEAVEAALRAGG